MQPIQAWHKVFFGFLSGRKYKSQRFKDWLMTGVTLDIKPNVQALEVISYLAYETVAQVTSLNFLQWFK